MKDLDAIRLNMKRKKTTMKELSKLSGYTYNQIRRMFRGDIKLKELSHIQTILE